MLILAVIGLLLMLFGAFTGMFVAYALFMFHLVFTGDMKKAVLHALIPFCLSLVMFYAAYDLNPFTLTFGATNNG